MRVNQRESATIDILRKITDRLETGVLMADAEGTIVAWNPTLEALIGIPASGAIGTKVWDFQFRISNHPERKDDPDKLLSTFKRSAQKFLAGDFGDEMDFGKFARFIEDDKPAYSDVHLFRFLTGKGPMLVAVFLDSTEMSAKLRKLRIRIRDKEELLQQVLDLVPHMIFARNLGGEFLLANRALAEAYGKEVSETIGRSIRNIDPAGKSLDAQLLDDAHVIESGETILIPEEHLDLPNGHKVFETTKIPFDVESTGEKAVLGVSIDITERLKAEKALDDEKERVVVTLRSIGEGVIATDTLGCITLMNPMAAEITGWDERDALGLHIGEVFRIRVGRMAQILKNPVYEIINERKLVQSAQDSYLIKKNGAVREIQERGAPIVGTNGDIIGAVIVFTDISEMKLIERELERIQKIESMGLVAGGVAHDFNNILTAVLGNISLARLSIPEGDEKALLLSEAEKAIAQARRLTAQLSSLAKGAAEPVRQPAEIGQLIRDNAAINLRGSEIDLVIDVPENLSLVAVDTTQIGQAIQNLVINARQALGPGGRVCISAKEMYVSHEMMLPLAPGDYVRIEVSDNGFGMSPDIVSRIFDPYFTTKSRGSGLGLTIAFSAIKKHGGCITVKSQPNEGTSFHIYLPVYRQTSVSAS